MNAQQKLIYCTLLTMVAACSSNDDDPATPGNDFIVPISQDYQDTASNKTYFFGTPDSLGRFTGNENESGNKNALVGRTQGFDISFTVIKDQFSNYVDYAGKITDTSKTNIRMELFSNTDSIYLKVP